jgi:hypothetical protein
VMGVGAVLFALCNSQLYLGHTLIIGP